MPSAASAEVALRGVVGEKTIDYTMTTGRMEIQKKVEIYLQRLLDTYNTGLQVTQSPSAGGGSSAQVQEAFHDVVRAWEDRERLIKEAEGFREDVIPKARGQAQQEIREAEAYKAQRVIRAKGDADRFSAVISTRSRESTEGHTRETLPGERRFLSACVQEVHNGGRKIRSLADPTLERDSQRLLSSPSPGTPAAGTSADKKGK